MTSGPVVVIVVVVIVVVVVAVVVVVVVVVIALLPAGLFKKTHRHKCFHVNFAKFFRRAF